MYDFKERMALGLCAALSMCVLMLLMYTGLTEAVCTRIDTFTATEQASMALNATECAKPWYAKL